MSLTNLSVISWNLITSTMFLAENALKIIYQLLGVGSFDQFGPGDWGQVIRLGCKCLYSLSHLSSQSLLLGLIVPAGKRLAAGLWGICIQIRKTCPFPQTTQSWEKDLARLSASTYLLQQASLSRAHLCNPGNWTTSLTTGQRWHVESGLESMRLCFHRYLNKSRDLPGIWEHLPYSGTSISSGLVSAVQLFQKRTHSPLGSLLPCEDIGITVRKTGHLFQPGLLSSGGTFNSSDSTE